MLIRNSQPVGSRAFLFISRLIYNRATVDPTHHRGLWSRAHLRARTAQGDLTRQPHLAAVTASTMMIGLAIIVALLGLLSSLYNGMLGGFMDKTLNADLC